MLGVSALLMIGRWCSDSFAEIPRGIALAVAVVVFVVLAGMIGFFGIHLGYPGGTLDGAAWLESYGHGILRFLHSRNIADTL